MDDVGDVSGVLAPALVAVIVTVAMVCPGRAGAIEAAPIDVHFAAVAGASVAIVAALILIPAGAMTVVGVVFARAAPAAVAAVAVIASVSAIVVALAIVLIAVAIECYQARRSRAAL